MGKKIRITRKSLKEDGVRSTSLEIFSWLQRNSKHLLTALCGVLVLFILAQAYSCHKTRRLTDANLTISRALGNIQMALLAQKEDQRDKRFADAQADLQLLAGAGGPLSAYAHYLLGNIAFFRNNYDEAEEDYKQFLNRVRDPVEKADGYVALGYTYENKYFWTQEKPEDRAWLDRAMQSYRQAETLTSGTMEFYLALLGQARLYELQDQNTKALEFYHRIEQARQLEPVKHSASFLRSPFEWAVADAERTKRLFTLAETARLRAERIGAAE